MPGKPKTVTTVFSPSISGGQAGAREQWSSAGTVSQCSGQHVWPRRAGRQWLGESSSALPHLSMIISKISTFTEKPPNTR